MELSPAHVVFLLVLASATLMSSGQANSAVDKSQSEKILSDLEAACAGINTMKEIIRSCKKNCCEETPRPTTTTPRPTTTTPRPTTTIPRPTTKTSRPTLTTPRPTTTTPRPTTTTPRPTTTTPRPTTTNPGPTSTTNHPMPTSTTKMPFMPYTFDWGVKHEKSGNIFSHSEKSEGQDVQGEYRVLLPDGRTQVVTFSANETSGYNAKVKYTKKQDQKRI